MSRRGVLKAGALLLGYPDRGRIDAVAKALGEIQEAPARDLLLTFLEAVGALADVEIEARYVADFDFREDLSLYLTFQERGDAQDRAPALLALKRQLRASGFSCPPDELPDYIPLLLEFLAELPEGRDDQGLAERLARALLGIAARLDEGSLYLPLLRAILTVLPAGGGASAAPQGGAEDRELPYPLSYR